MIVFLDSGVLGVLCSSQKTDTVSQCKQWLNQLLTRGIYVISSEICDYEVRRSLLLNQIKNPLATRSLNNLDELQEIIEFLPLTTPVMRQPAHLWAETRRQGFPTADIENIDVDVIIGEQKWESSLGLKNLFWKIIDKRSCSVFPQKELKFNFGLSTMS